MDDLLKLVDECKCDVNLTFNPHKSDYETVERWLASAAAHAEIPDQIRAEMIARDAIVDLQFYPETPIGSYSVYHYDLAAALAEGVRILEEHRRQRQCNTATCG